VALTPEQRQQRIAAGLCGRCGWRKINKARSNTQCTKCLDYRSDLRKQAYKDAGPEFFVWQSMVGRCHQINHQAYQNYGARGIAVCKRWRGMVGFKRFLADMGRRPSPKHTIERKKNHKGYSPSNCKWATQAEQNRNTRVTCLHTIDGETLCFLDWCRRYNIPRSTVRNRMLRGKSFIEALTG
jgi:hypothetical protein